MVFCVGDVACRSFDVLSPCHPSGGQTNGDVG